MKNSEETNSEQLRQIEAWLAEAEAAGAEVEIPELWVETAVPLPIPRAARELADEFAAEQPSPAKAEQVRRDTLGAIVLRDYLQFLGYVPDLAASDCWNPILRRLDRVADLVVAEVGRLECCVFAPGQDEYGLSIAQQTGRSVYVAVHLNAENTWAWLLGFVPGADVEEFGEELCRADLQSMDDLGQLLHRLVLLARIVREQEPWLPELRQEVVVMLERLYRTERPAQRPVAAAAAVSRLLGAGADLDDPKERGLLGVGSRERGANLEEQQLVRFLREAFDQLSDELEALGAVE